MSDPGVSWQESVARLKQERTVAESYAQLLKKYGSEAAVDRGSIDYSDAKAEYDALVAALIVVLARKQKPSSLPDLQDRLIRGHEKQQKFCHSVEPLLPSSEGKKGLVADAIKGAVSPLIDAVKDIYLRSKDDDALMRKTIQTQLESAVWMDFKAIEKES